jgi:hypothetical protein
MSAHRQPVTDRNFTAKYRVQRKGGGKARAQHKTFEAAEAEAARLLALFPEATFYVLHEVARVRFPSGEQPAAAHG